MNLYSVLDVDSTCSKEDIKKAYKKLALKYHPDKNKDKEEEAQREFIQISHAYQILYNEHTRKQYDIGVCIDYNEHLSCEELFHTIFKEVDPKLSQFIYTTYEKINEAIDASHSGHFLEIYEHIDKKKILLNGAELFADYMLSTLNNPSKNKTVDTAVIPLKKNHNHKIELPLETYLTNETYKISIVDETDTSYSIQLKTQYSNQNIQINNHMYSVELIDKPHTFYNRVNSYDLYSSMDIGIEDYFSGFSVCLDYFSRKIELNVQLVYNQSCILKIEKYGLPIWTEHKRGDLYITFHLTKCERLHSPLSSTHTHTSMDVYELIDTISIY